MRIRQELAAPLSLATPEGRGSRSRARRACVMRERISGGSFLRSRSAAELSRTRYGTTASRQFPTAIRAEVLEGAPQLSPPRSGGGQSRLAGMEGEFPSPHGWPGRGGKPCSPPKTELPPPPLPGHFGRIEAPDLLRSHQSPPPGSHAINVPRASGPVNLRT